MSDHLYALPKGYRLEEYEIVRVLGTGGFGITYLGFDNNLDKAVGYFEEAIAFDPEYADAYGWLSRMHNLYVWGNFDSAANRLPLVEDYIEKALILDPNQVEALATLASNRFFVKREYQHPPQY